MSDYARLARQELARRTLARRSYRHYLYYVHAPVWRRTALSDFLARQVQTFVETVSGNAYDILLIETPPQHGKSLTVTETFPSWYLGRYPRNRVIEASYNEETARRFGRKNLEKVKTFGCPLFGIRTGGSVSAGEFELDNGWGRMISRGITSGITGQAANLLLIDDPVKNRAEADSRLFRDKLWEEWQSTLKSRLAAGGKVIVIMTPWHEDDLAGRLLRSEPHVTLLRLPVEAEENDPLGRPVGAPLCPELGKGAAWLEQFKAAYCTDPHRGGVRAWQALYQCAPRVEGGNLIRRSWWRTYDPEGADPFAVTVISVDAAFKDNPDGDFVAIEVWGKSGGNYYLRYCLNQRLDFPGTLAAIRLVKRLYPESRCILVEDKANGSAVIQTLRREIPGVVGVTPRGGKISRVNAVAPAIESGNVFVPRACAWAEAFLDQFTAFPAVSHDDMVDAASQALQYLIFSPPIQAETAERRDDGAAALLDNSIYDVYR